MVCFACKREAQAAWQRVSTAGCVPVRLHLPKNKIVCSQVDITGNYNGVAFYEVVIRPGTNGEILSENII